MTQEQKKLLEKQLWAVADVLRGRMNAGEYQNYILGFIFYKYLSEKLRHEADKILEADGISFDDLTDEKVITLVKGRLIEELGYFLRPDQLFVNVVRQGSGELEGKDTFILEDLKNTLTTIEQTSAGTDSEDDFRNLFGDVKLSSAKLGRGENDKNTVVVEVLSLLGEIDFQIDQDKSDLLGDAYEYLIGEFASGAGKKGGEFYTPSQVSTLLTQIVTHGKKRIKSAYDPTCGSGSLLLKLKSHVDVVDYYGQELNPTTYNLARMNMILRGVHFNQFDIRHGDTLAEDMHPDLRAEAIVANPPFSAQWKSDTDPVLAQDERFMKYGRLAPKGAADYAFVTHMLYHLAEDGTMAIVLPHGVLFRGGAEEVIRRHIIERENQLDTVIGLPANLFYGTSIPATILVFKKCREQDKDILFIDASREFQKGKNQNTLTQENLDKIFETYTKRTEIERYSHRASLEEIVENDYNLNIPRYVDTFEPEEPIDISAVAGEIRDLKKDEGDLQGKIAGFCDELGIDKPF